MTEQNKIAEYSKTEAALSILREKCLTTVYDIKTPQGIKTAIALRAEIRTNRTGIEKVRKEVKAPILALGKLVDSEAERLTAELLALEKPIDDAIKAEEKEKADAKRLEDERKAKVSDFYTFATQIVIDCIGKSSAVIKVHLDSFGERPLDQDVFLTDFDDAKKVKIETENKLFEMYEDAKSGEEFKENKRVADEKNKQAILDRMQVFTVSESDIKSIELIAQKLNQVENTVVDSLYGEFEQQAHEAKANALEYLLNAEHDLIRAKEALDLAEKPKAEQEQQALVDHEYTDVGTGETVIEYEPAPIVPAEWQDCSIKTANDAVLETALAMLEVTPVDLSTFVYHPDVDESMPAAVYSIGNTTKPILISENTPPKDKNCLMNAGSKYFSTDRHWIECFFVRNENGGFWEACNSDEARPDHATHWLPVPEIDHDDV